MKANKLKDLKVTSVDLVEAGANQHAHIQFKKRREDDAAAAPDETADSAFFARIGATIAKAFHITKGDAKTFSQMESRRDVDETIWDISDALCSSLRSIIGDDDLTASEKHAKISDTADQVRDAIIANLGDIVDQTALPEVSKGAEEQDAPDEDEKPAEKGCQKPKKTAKAASKEGAINMSEFDTTNLTQEEKAQFELFKSKIVVKSTTPPATPVFEPEKDPVVKAMREQIESMRADTKKMHDQMEQRELEGVAKKYELLGKKPEELVPVLKSMKAAGDAVYDEYIKTLDEHMEVVEKSGVFSEIGKRGEGAASNPVDKVSIIAAEIRKSKPDMSVAEAMDEAWAQHPELLNEYEQTR